MPRPLIRSLRWPVIILALAPLVAVGAIYWLTRAQTPERYDPAFFTQEHLERYRTPGAAALGIEEALQTGDFELMRELHGTIDAPSSFVAQPTLSLYDLYTTHGNYYSYLYVTADRKLRVTRQVTWANWRYVAAQEDLLFLFDSGKWPQTFAPLAFGWWGLVGLVAGLTWLGRRGRAWTYPGKAPLL